MSAILVAFHVNGEKCLRTCFNYFSEIDQSLARLPLHLVNNKRKDQTQVLIKSHFFGYYLWVKAFFWYTFVHSRYLFIKKLIKSLRTPHLFIELLTSGVLLYCYLNCMAF